MGGQPQMNILLVGGGGREHALAWKIVASPLVRRLVCAPGNPGIAGLCDVRPVAVTNIDGLEALATEMAADLVVVGPEAALEAGLADRMAECGVPCFGPSARAARIETSKAFMKGFASRHGIPTAPCGVFEEVGAAKAFLRSMAAPYVIKADGLAAGKGVVIADGLAQSDLAIEAFLGRSGAKVVIEGFMTGGEVSSFALSDGANIMAFGAAQDHKRALDGDLGPNTGGMGAFSPAMASTRPLVEEAGRSIVTPTLRGLAAEGAPYRGVIFAGLMLTGEGPKLVEFNARFGDPECQPLMLRLESDIVPYLAGAARGDLARVAAPRWRDEWAICVVLAAKGYPEAPQSGSVISGAEADFGDDVVIFHAGTARRDDGALIAAGGRVLNVCARGPNLKVARDRAYEAIGNIDWPGGFHRSDIGARAADERGLLGADGSGSLE